MIMSSTSDRKFRIQFEYSSCECFELTLKYAVTTVARGSTFAGREKFWIYLLFERKTIDIDATNKM